jgi:hypothetical protein
MVDDMPYELKFILHNDIQIDLPVRPLVCHLSLLVHLLRSSNRPFKQLMAQLKESEKANLPESIAAILKTSL